MSERRQLPNRQLGNSVVEVEQSVASVAGHSVMEKVEHPVAKE